MGSVTSGPVIDHIRLDTSPWIREVRRNELELLFELLVIAGPFKEDTGLRPDTGLACEEEAGSGLEDDGQSQPRSGSAFADLLPVGLIEAGDLLQDSLSVQASGRIDD